MKLLLSILLIVAVSFSKTAFFNALESNDKEAIESLEKKLAETTVNNDQKAYYGAILMKSSDFQKTAGEKLKKFKSGHALLEEMITKNPKNIEYRLLRLMIQEHAPKVVKYNTNILDDAQFIKENTAQASKEIKTIITDYAKVSKNLKL
ncbi:MAG: hypothetical protein M9916_08380 [Crocinitomicaceae bacterium]|nr:hypothetical protein [Crocinitomicaceae bacterium]